MVPLALLMMYTYPITTTSFQSSEFVPDIQFKCRHSPPNSLYINNQQPHYLLCTSVTPPKDELQHQLRKFVIKSLCPEEAFYFQTKLMVL